MRKNIFIFIISALVFISLLFPGCKRKDVEPISQDDSKDEPLTSFLLSEEAQQLAGIETEVVQIRPVSFRIKAFGEVIFNPKKFANLTSRTAGRVEEVFVFPGDKIKAGQVLCSLYSPDFLSLQAEFIQAEERLKRAKENEGEEMASAQAIFDSARNRLLLLNLREEDIGELEKTHVINPLLAVRAPFSASLIESQAISGDYVSTGASLFKIADLSIIWVDIHIYEKDISQLRLGALALVKVSVSPDEEFRGKLILLNDVVDEKTRTVRGTVEVANSGGELKPGMFAEVELLRSLTSKSLFIPEAALQDYENKKIVFVVKGKNAFSLQEVETGVREKGLIEVLKGLKENERIVTKGSFLLKSELLKKNLGVE